MLGRLTFDKSSLNMNLFLKSVRIVSENNGEISRYEFVRNMEIFMSGHTTLPEQKPDKYVESGAHRTQYNKSKWPRYFGFIDIKSKNNDAYLVLTKRGQLLDEIISVKEEDGVFTYYVEDDNKKEFSRLIVESILYGTFGKNNAGAETSNTDIELPKIIFKAILLLGKVSSSEALFIAFGMNKKQLSSFEEGIGVINEWRSLPADTYRIKLENKMQEYDMVNFASDDKFISIYSDDNIGLLTKFTEDDFSYYTISQEALHTYKNEFQQLLPVYRPLQIVLSGVPGTGKSYYVDRCILGGVSDYNCIIRTTIHPEYTYSDFIGYIRPKVINKKIKYIFEPGPLTKAILKCLLEPSSNIYLIIEEMNRGDIASIMGDMFQLLDRIDDYKANNHGTSRYPITNKTLYDYLAEKLSEAELSPTKYLPDKKIVFPANLNIVATMNTSDQNVFVLDTAFRRRFRNMYLKIDFSDAIREGTYLNSIEKLSKETLFTENRGWSDFANMVNRKIDSLNAELSIIPEDKKLAPYFVDANDLSSRDAFCDKVIYYLKNDVFKYVEGVLPESYEQLYKQFVIEGKDFFELF